LDEFIDLRSDTVTKPTPEMREAMRDAAVGDDVMGEDPTVNRLEELAAETVGMEAALFVASGTMANQAAIYTHTQPGQEIILEAECHCLNFEAGAIAALAGCQARPIRGHRGAMDPSDVEAAIRGDNIHYPRTGLICLENTHNMASGVAISRENTGAIIEMGIRYGIPVHIDGARIFNAAVALGLPVQELVAGASSLAFCFSKGLACPVGSVICGSAAFIREARRTRKMLGGGMRQAGVLAAPAIIGLTKMVGRLHEDHANARLLAETLANLPGVEIDLDAIMTNIVIFDVGRDDMNAAGLAQALKHRGILANPRSDRRMRLVTHNDVSREDTLRACEVLQEVLG
jgi:threonine aldolase